LVPGYQFPVPGWCEIRDLSVNICYHQVFTIKYSSDDSKSSDEFFEIIRRYFSSTLLYFFHHFCKLLINRCLNTIFLSFPGNIAIVIIHFGSLTPFN